MDRAAAFLEFADENRYMHNNKLSQLALEEFQKKHPEPIPFDFIGQALCTKSDKFYGENVLLLDLQNTLGEMIVAGNKLDAIKKALFYGKPYPQSDERSTETCISVPHGWIITPHPSEPRLVTISEVKAIDIIHALIGKATEAVEGLELLLHTIKTKEFDQINAKEETFDGQWYDAILCNAIGITFEDGQRNNIAKLRKRYGDKFTEYDAINRDLSAERVELEASSTTTNVADMEFHDSSKMAKELIEPINVQKEMSRLDEFNSHAADIRNAFVHARESATKLDDRDYWTHQIKWFDSEISDLTSTTARRMMTNDEKKQLADSMGIDLKPNEILSQLPFQEFAAGRMSYKSETPLTGVVHAGSDDKPINRGRQFIGSGFDPKRVDEALLSRSTDAQVWATEFAKVVPSVDTGLMLGWFANCIDTAKRSATGEL